MLPHEYKPPQFYTTHEGGEWLPFPPVRSTPLPAAFFRVVARYTTSRGDDLPIYVHFGGIQVHSLLWVRYGDQPEDYIIQERWDCINGFTCIPTWLDEKNKTL